MEFLTARGDQYHDQFQHISTLLRQNVRLARAAVT
ncbi:MAG: hypothetical protein DDT38_01688 [Firmicutes bacterium]|nr:hypothetical protein [candidate division NPL-UPA2 bacterium]